MIDKLFCALLVIVGLINFAPLMGVVSAERLSSLYGVALTDPNLVVVMRHRAILFGLMGGTILVAAFYRPLVPLALVFGFVSMIGYAALVFTGGEVNAQLQKVLWVDIVALVLLVIASGLYFARLRGA